MTDIKETSIVLIKENKQEAAKLLELLNGFNKKELSDLLMFMQGVKFSKQLDIQSNRVKC